MTDIDTKELRRLMDEATAGPVKWWTSNSWRRLRRDDRGIAQSIAEPYVARDGHPDIAIKQADMDFIAALWNSAPALLSEAEEAARLREELAALRAAPAAEPVAQCCMCGKTGLSTVEGDGGSECQLSDGRWTCSFECWERATERDAPPAPVADGWRPDAEKMREACARWCEANGFADAAPMLRKLPISRSRDALKEGRDE